MIARLGHEIVIMHLSCKCLQLNLAKYRQVTSGGDEYFARIGFYVLFLKTKMHGG